MANVNCLDCQKGFLFTGGDKCPSCGGQNIEILSAERVEEGMDSGVLYNIDPKTGKRAKNKKR